LAAALAGEFADRPPVALWRHFPVDDQEPASLAKSTVAFQQLFDFDFVKLTPASSFAVRGWGVEDDWQGSEEGTRVYTRRAVVAPEDWRKLTKLDPHTGALADCLACLAQVRESLGPETPILATVFSPLAQAKNLAGENVLLEHLRRSPEDLTAGLATLAATTIDFIEAARALGIDGIFYAVQHARSKMMDLPSYRRLAEPHDRAIFEAADGLWLNVLHLHGEGIHFELAEEYPADVVNWHDRETSPHLSEGKRRSGKAVCGGIARVETLVLGDPGRIADEADEARRQTDGGRGLILGTGCVVPITAPLGNLRAVRAAAGPE
jgi:uroporphyrinogen decarboxylase